ncbi:MAG: magnesium transporter CorA family protein [Spirochaetes bacterium]|nr:magnesium transporter CorA family protein [Spirochaetota bacterium]
MASTKSFFHVPPDGTPVAVPDLDSALKTLGDGGYLWLNLLDPAREDLEALAAPFGIHPLAIEDCLDDEQIPKIEDYPTNTFILFNKFNYESRELFINEVDLFLGKNFLILVSHNIHGDPNFLDRLEQMAGLDRENVLQGPDYLLHVIMDYLVDQKFETIGSLRDELDGIEERIIDEIALFRPEELMRLRRSLLMLRKSIIHEREILVKICRKDSRFINEKSIYEFRDIYDHLSKFFEEAEIYREMISSFMEMYLSMMNTRMSMAANRTNRVVRRLTMITTIFMPMTLLSGIGGMSEWSMMTGSENWKVAYPVFLLLMMLVGIGSYLILKRLEGRDNDSGE